MEDQKLKFNNAVVRIHFSDRTKEERNEAAKIAAEKYMKNVLFRARKGSDK